MLLEAVRVKLKLQLKTQEFADPMDVEVCGEKLQAVSRTKAIEKWLCKTVEALIMAGPRC
jgi:hypothetical protein